jgi:hypothetical protein
MAIILSFPSSRSRQWRDVVRVEREIDGDGWLALKDCYGWAHGSFTNALRDAREIAAGYGVSVISSAGTFTC